MSDVEDAWATVNAKRAALDAVRRAHCRKAPGWMVAVVMVVAGLVAEYLRTRGMYLQ